MALLSELNDLKVYFYDGRDKRFIRAVENVGFTLNEGSVFGVVGESGCGKTATALSMMGLIESEPGLIGGKFFFKPSPEDAGAIAHALNRGTYEQGDYKRENLYNLFWGLDRFVHYEENPFTIIKDSEKWLRRNDRVMEHIRGKNISMVFQNPGRSLNPFVPIGVQLERTIKRFIGEKDKYEIRERAVELLRSVRLKRPELVMNMYAGTLSLGMAQRVIIAIALSSHPRLLIADEPTTGLDTTNIHSIIDLLETLRNEMNLTLLLISHNIRIVSTIATDILVMYSGIVVEMGSKKDVIIVKRGFRHPYTEALVSSIPSDTDIKRGKKLRVIPGIVPNNKREMDFCPFLDRCSYARGKIRRKCKSACPELLEVSQGHYIRCYLFSS